MKLLKNTFIYLGSNLLEKGIGIILIPLYTNYLTPAEYGKLAIYYMFINIGILLFSLGLQNSARRFFFEIEKQKYISIHYGNILLLSFLGFLFGGVIFFTTIKYALLFFNIEYNFFLVLLIFLIMVFNYIFIIYQQKIQLEEQAILFLVISNIRTILFIVFVYYLLTNSKLHIIGILISILLSYLIVDIFIFFKLILKVEFNFNKKLSKRNLLYSSKLLPHNLSSLFSSAIDKTYISRMLSMHETGVYYLGNQFASIIGIISNSINRAVGPHILKSFHHKEYKFIENLAYLLIYFILFISFTNSLFAKEIILLFSNSSYEKATSIFVVLNYYFVFQMYYFMTVGILFFDLKATRFLPMITMSALLLNLGLNYIFINSFGLIGAAFATLFSIVFVNVAVIIIGRLYIELKLNHIVLHTVIICSFAINWYSLDLVDWKYKIFILFTILLFYIFLLRNNLFIKKYLYKKVS